MKLRLIVVATIVLTLAACGRKSAVMQDELNRVDALGAPAEKLAALTQLDQGNPAAFGVKFRLGELYLQLGQIDVASVYLREADRLGRARGIAAAESRAATLEYARTLILSNKPDQAIPVVMPLARSGDPAPLLVRGRAYILSGNAKSALADFAAALASKNAELAGADYTLYAQALAAENRYADALGALRDCEKALGYQPGTGLLESSLLEKLGRAQESVLAAFKETLYQETQGSITRDQIDRNLAALATRVDAPGMGGPRAQKVVSGLRLYLQGKWAEAATALSAGLAGLDDPFGSFLLAACSLEKDKVSAERLASFVALEPRYRSYPEFYLRLWRAMKKGPGQYTLANVRNVLEKTVLLAPRSADAAASRSELGRLLGLDPDDARDLLLRPELDIAYARLSGGADPGQVLPPVLRLLSIRKENVYTSDGVLMLKSAVRIPGVGAYLQAQAGSARGALKDRLSQIL